MESDAETLRSAFYRETTRATTAEWALRTVVVNLGRCSVGRHCDHLREAQEAAESALGKTYAELIRE